MTRSALLLPVVVITSVALLLAMVIVRVEHITCRVSGGNSCPEELLTQLAGLKGQRIFFNQPHLGQQVSGLSSSYRLGQLNFELPGTLHVTLQEQQPSYQLKLAQTQEFKVINAQGNIMSTGMQTDVPTFIVTSEVWDQLGDAQSFSQHTLFTSWLASLKQFDGQFVLFYLADSQTLVGYLPNQQAVLMDPQALPTSLTRLSLITTAAETQETLATTQEIDVRFKLPVLRTALTVPRHDSL